MEPTAARLDQARETVRTLQSIIDKEARIELKHPGALAALYGDHILRVMEEDICFLDEPERWYEMSCAEQMMDVHSGNELYETASGTLVFAARGFVFAWRDGEWVDIDDPNLPKETT